MAAKEYSKHLIECKCVLPQFKNHNPPKWHCFIVFSEIDESGAVIPSYAQCNNCGIVHKVIEISTSTILGKDSISSLPQIDELKSSIPDKLAKILESYNCELPVFQEVIFILEHQLWGRPVILTKELLDNMMVGKYLVIIGESLWKINNFQEEIGDV